LPKLATFENYAFYVQNTLRHPRPLRSLHNAFYVTHDWNVCYTTSMKPLQKLITNDSIDRFSINLHQSTRNNVPLIYIPNLNFSRQNYQITPEHNFNFPNLKFIKNSTKINNNYSPQLKLNLLIRTNLNNLKNLIII